MAEDRKIVIEKFNASDFCRWKVQVKALMCQSKLFGYGIRGETKEHEIGNLS